METAPSRYKLVASDIRRASCGALLLGVWLVDRAAPVSSLPMLAMRIKTFSGPGCFRKQRPCGRAGSALFAPAGGSGRFKAHAAITASAPYLRQPGPQTTALRNPPRPRAEIAAFVRRQTESTV